MPKLFTLTQEALLIIKNEKSTLSYELLFQNNRPESQYRLRCTLTGTQFKSTQNNRLQSGIGKEITPTSSTLASANKQLENLSKKVSRH